MHVWQLSPTIQTDCSDKAQEFLIMLWKERNSKSTVFKISKTFQIHFEQLKCKFKTWKLNTAVGKIIICLTGFFETCFLCIQSNRVTSLLIGLHAFSQWCPLLATASSRENTRWWYHCDHPNSFTNKESMNPGICSFRDGNQTTGYTHMMPQRPTTSVR